MGSSGSGYEPVADYIKPSNEPTGSIKCSKFLYQMSDYKLVKVNLFHGISCE